MTEKGGVKNRPNLHDVIYEWSSTSYELHGELNMNEKRGHS